ncbi:B128 [miniopterid betaherpesvirus 1]|uniref:B128 n=1 Tax=miniopterid betaherpesvirus 1 TaxID=3070189 RepID=I3VQC5_9BETA|nr:B128 [miniopterid betaherpesvirus 1]AFK83969.1 B128 [miniopterid betaherpesvirus 1]
MQPPKNFLFSFQCKSGDVCVRAITPGLEDYMIEVAADMTNQEIYEVLPMCNRNPYVYL